MKRSTCSRYDSTPPNLIKLREHPNAFDTDLRSQPKQIARSAEVLGHEQAEIAQVPAKLPTRPHGRRPVQRRESVARQSHWKPPRQHQRATIAEWVAVFWGLASAAAERDGAGAIMNFAAFGRVRGVLVVWVHCSGVVAAWNLDACSIPQSGSGLLNTLSHKQ